MVGGRGVGLLGTMAMAGPTHVHSSSDEDLRLRKTGRRVWGVGYTAAGIGIGGA